jgi:TolA-binding protein
MPDFFLPILSIGIALVAAAGTIGFVVSFVGNRNRGLSEVQMNTISALQAQNQAQGQQIQALEKKITRLEGVIHTLQYTLKERRRLKLEVKDDFVLLLDERTGAEITVPIHTSGPLEKLDKES